MNRLVDDDNDGVFNGARGLAVALLLSPLMWGVIFALVYYLVE